MADSAADTGGPALDIEALKAGLAPQPAESLYEDLAEAGLEYGPRFRVVKSVWSGEGEALVEVVLSAGVEAGDAAAPVMLLDGCFQGLAAAVDDSDGNSDGNDDGRGRL